MTSEPSSLPLLRRQMALGDSDWLVDCCFDSQRHLLRFTATHHTEVLHHDIIYTGSCDVRALHQRAEEATKELVVKDGKLGLRSGFDVQYRTGKSIRETFYLISIGFQGDQLVIEAADQKTGQKLISRLEWSGNAKTLKTADADELASKLDVSEIAGTSVLLIK